MSKKAVNDKAIVRGLTSHSIKVARVLLSRAPLTDEDFQKVLDLIDLCEETRGNWFTVRAHLIETNRQFSTPGDVMKSVFALDEFFRE